MGPLGSYLPLLQGNPHEVLFTVHHITCQLESLLVFIPVQKLVVLLVPAHTRLPSPQEHLCNPDTSGLPISLMFSSYPTEVIRGYSFWLLWSCEHDLFWFSASIWTPSRMDRAPCYP